ncbi:MAG: hypothetical protein WBE58_09155 [Verrucomicrobiales bacterium]
MRERSAWLLLLGILAAGPLALPLREARMERRARVCLLELQKGLQRYVVREEMYPKRSPLNGAELVEVLLKNHDLAEPPINPLMGAPYGKVGETDWLVYRTDQQAETYSIQFRDPDKPDEPLLELDNTEHQSLE